ncbi:hypothetical protein [Stutzerimonas xanthomarina]|uniref:Uncharacterized protein n=2 Tax=Stutzerimonas xanthomarina TaxID=271420 RepID=A0A1M5TAY5_9GAMM|nr:hypothetical protein [Stutzerimonas xanthomarina]MCP9340341.1 hypothetical protein [Stutzerimonas xanthomarina]SEH61220.1 hypothetical protein SAMN05216535_0816 [Stutzerimonas xanthomarina]SHH47861.1 hypothetical protein SAMN02744645_3862 [Stutzerimonas xanthomarina DSM 18231]
MQVGTPEKESGGSLWVLELIKNHFAWISATVAAMAPIAGIFSLVVYVNYIGRPDVLLRSLQFSPSLIVLVLAFILFFVAIVGSMLITSYFFSLVPAWLRPKPEYGDSFTRRLFGVTVLGMLGIVFILGIASQLDRTLESPWWLLVVFILPAVFSWPFINGHLDKAEYLAAPLAIHKGILACVLLTILVGVTALLGIYPAWYVMRFYEGRSGMSGLTEALLFCLLTMAGSLAPAVGYYMSINKNRAAQVKSALAGVLIFLGILTLTAPPVFSFASVGSMSVLGLSDRQVRKYLVSSEDYPADYLNQLSWNATSDGGKKYTLEAFSLYEFGPVTLLCPAAMRTVKNNNLKDHTNLCIAFKSDAVLPLHAISDDI